MRSLQEFVAECEAFLASHSATRKNQTQAEDQHTIDSHERRSVEAEGAGGWATLKRFVALRLDDARYKRSAWADMALIRAAHLFDDDYYALLYPDARQHSEGLLEHYLRVGGSEGRNPTRLFDGAYYLNQYPDIVQAGVNPLCHYIRHGCREWRNPHPYFDTKWYINQVERRGGQTSNPIWHYLEIGAGWGLSPSPMFDTAWYVQRYPDVVLQKINPLLHYLEYGRYEGRVPTRSAAVSPGSSPVTSASISCLKYEAIKGEAALFVTHSPCGYVKPHVMHYVQGLRSNGISVILIVAADIGLHADNFDLSSVEGLFVRQNLGLDFAAWAHVIRLHPELLDVDALYFLNDSLFGPTNDVKFASLLDGLRRNDADFIGMTDNYELGWHVQSYFLVVRRKALASQTIRAFLERIVSYNDKDDVIKEYEIKFSQAIRASGLKYDVLFPSAEAVNFTLLRWKDLLRRGFPFVKVMAIRDQYGGGDERTWQDFLHAEGFDTSLVDQTLLLGRIAGLRSLMARS